MRSVTEVTVDWAEQRGIAYTLAVQTGSTNDDAKQNSLNETDSTKLYLAAHQTAGRGRGTNRWLDTGAGEALLSTWSLAVPRAPQAITGPRVGLALFAAARKAWPSLDFGLKAPNDLFLGERKVAGLLIESVASRSSYRLLIGLGFNVFSHPRRLDTATHLAGATGYAGEEGEWYQFLDEWSAQLRAGVAEVVAPELSTAARAELVKALNANRARAFVVTDVSPRGDLHHAKGVVPWTDL